MLAGGAKHTASIPLFCSSSVASGLHWSRDGGAQSQSFRSQRLGGGGVCHLVLGIGDLDDDRGTRLDALLFHGF